MKRMSIGKVLEKPEPNRYFYVLVTRYYPRALRFKRMKFEESPLDEWDRDLAPSPSLLKDYKAGLISWEQYTEKYLKEAPPALIKRKAETYKERAKGKEVVFVCEEEDWEYPKCHTWIMLDVLGGSNPYKVVRFLKDHTWITGADMRRYGPFTKGQVVSLPTENADQLIKLGVAVDTRKVPEEPSLKKVFKGEVLTGFVEAARGRTLNEFRERSPEEIEKKRAELLREIREIRKELEGLKRSS